MLFYYAIQYLLISLLSLAALYILVFAIAGLFYKQRVYRDTGKFRKIAVLIPGYREDAVIVEVARAALQQQYPRTRFDVVVIADSFKRETLDTLKGMPIQLIEVSFDKSTKSKALNRAMELLSAPYEIAVVLDADNMMAGNFLAKVNATFEYGCIAVQGHRTAKNTNNEWAILDAVSEEINNHIFRKGHRVLGLSSAIIGSGMAFNYNYFKSLMASVTAVGGFDKEIELKMLKQGNKIIYLDDAYVYDEKIQQSDVFSNQRRRWLAAQFHYFKSGFGDAVKCLFTQGNVDYFDKAIQFIQPPRILLLGATFFFGALFILLNSLFETGHVASACWVVIMISCVTAMIASVPRAFFKISTLTALAALPRGMVLMGLSLLKIKGANKTFLHTKHSSTNINTRY